MTAGIDLKERATGRAATEIDRRLAPRAQSLAQRLDRVADALGERTRGLDGTLGERADAAVATVRGAARYVRTLTVRRTLADGERLVRRSPRASAATLACVGFLAARYVKAAPRSKRSETR